MKSEFAEPCNSHIEGNALTACGYLLRELCKLLLAAAAYMALGIDLEPLL